MRRGGQARSSSSLITAKSATRYRGLCVYVSVCGPRRVLSGPGLCPLVLSVPFLDETRRGRGGVDDAAVPRSSVVLPRWYRLMTVASVSDDDGWDRTCYIYAE